MSVLLLIIKVGLRFSSGFMLFIIAMNIFLLLSLVNYVVLLFKGKSRGYFKSTAINIDRFGNHEFRSLFNMTLRKPQGYKFGNFEETISSVLGKNQRDNTLSRTGKILAGILDFIDKDHCKKSIKEFDETINKK